MLRRIRLVVVRGTVGFLVAFLAFILIVNISPVSIFHYSDGFMIAAFRLGATPLLAFGKSEGVLADQAYEATSVCFMSCSHKGYAYVPNMESLLATEWPRTPQLVESLDSYHSRGGTFEVYRHISGDWYLYYFNWD